MGHTLYAIIGRLPAMTDLPIRFEGATLVSLEQGYVMSPLTEELCDAIAFGPGAPQPVRHRDGFFHLHEALDTLLTDLSLSAPVAYVETDYFGGVGTQAAAACIEGTLTITGRHTNDAGDEVDSQAINAALAAIGVKRMRGKDEFDTLGLGRHRSTDDWVDDAEAAEAPVLRNQEAGLLDLPLSWHDTGDAVHPYTTKHEGRVLVLRLNDWPDAPHLWTLLASDVPVLHVDEWPPAWRRPSREG